MNGVILKANLCTMALNLGFTLVAIVIGLLALKVLDKWVFPEIDFIAEIKRGNVAAAILAGTMLLFMALILSSGVR